MTFRPFDPDTDRDAARRIWHECGWLEDEDKTEPMDLCLAAGRAHVADVDGAAECLVLTTMGRLRHLAEDLPMCAVTGVSTSFVARKQGLAGRLTAGAIARDVADGAITAGLGMFEQGYYDRLGFGSAAYSHRVAFDPSRLRVEPATRVPRRLTADDWELIHASRLAGRRGHGACTLLAPEVTRADLVWAKRGVGLGFCDGPDGELTHHFFMSNRDDTEQGPLRMLWMAYQDGDQLLELLGLLRNLGDQMKMVRMNEPPGVQMQDLVHKPFERRQISLESTFDSRTETFSLYQFRLCDLPACLERTHLPGTDEWRFNLRMQDPIESLLPEDSTWRGTSGEYIVTLGPSCGAERGRDGVLPTLDASVGAFTRLWLGVRPATGLALTDELSGPPDLLERLDWTLRLPQPHPDWQF